jgi:hypothetical protein
VLVDHKVSSTGVVIGYYEPAGEIVTGSFALLPNFCLRVAAVSAEGLHEGQFSLFGPAGYGLGRDMQDVRYLCGPKVARVP